MIRIGGITFAIPFLSLIFFQLLFWNFYPPNLKTDYLNLKIIFFGGLIAYLIGLLDDIFNLNHHLRLVSQLILGSLTWLFGIKIENFQIDFFNYNFNFDIPIIVSLIITTIWIAGIINAINWMDGIDGLASGISLIAAITFLLLSKSYSSSTILLTSSTLAGCCLGFLKFNKNPAKILMGDGGSYFLGYILSLIAILSCFYRSNSIERSDLYIILVPILILIIPLSDMCFVILKRLTKGVSPFRGDENHLHHRLLRMGFTESSTVKLIIAISIIFSSLALMLENNYYESALFLISIYPLCNKIKKINLN